MAMMKNEVEGGIARTKKLLNRSSPDGGLPSLEAKAPNSLFLQLLLNLSHFGIDFMKCAKIIHHHLSLYFLAQSLSTTIDCHEINKLHRILSS